MSPTRFLVAQAIGTADGFGNDAGQTIEISKHDARYSRADDNGKRVIRIR